MRKLLTCLAVAPSVFILVAACQPKPDAPPPAPAPAYGYPGAAQGPGGYPPAGQAPPPAYGYGAPPPAPAPAPVPAPATSGQMAVPGPIAFACKDDVPCGTHHCNLQYGKCAFPCQSVADCLAPNQCAAGFCVPLPPQAH